MVAVRVRTELTAHPVLYVSLAVAITALALLCLVRGEEPERGRRTGPQTYKVVDAAVEALEDPVWVEKQ